MSGMPGTSEEVEGAANQRQMRAAGLLQKKRNLGSMMLSQHESIEREEGRLGVWNEPGAPKIPHGLSDEEILVYRRLIRVKRDREADTHPPEVVVITDLAKDYDDLSAMIVLKELHRLGLIKLLGFIANLHPPQQRAQFGRTCLDSLKLYDVPVCWGEVAEADPKKLEDPKPWEFPKEKEYFKNIWAEDVTFTPLDKDKKDETNHHELQSGVNFLERIVRKRTSAGGKDPKPTKITFLLISGLADAATIAKREPENLALATNKIVLQGDYKMAQGPTSYHAVLEPNLGAANNAFDKQAATEFHEYIDNHHIPSIVFTRAPAMCCRMDQKLFQDLKDTCHPLGEHLAFAQELQDTAFYERACNEDPAKRFLPQLDQGWFLNGKTNWYQKNPNSEDGSPPKEPPVREKIIPFVELVFYDVLAAIGVAGNDVLNALQLLDPPELFANSPHIHKIVGYEKKNPALELDKDAKPKLIPIPEMNVKNTQTVVSALMKGSLKAVQQKIPSTHTSWETWSRANQKTGSENEEP